MGEPSDPPMQAGGNDMPAGDDKSPEAVLAQIRGLSAEDRARIEAACADLRRSVEARARASEELLSAFMEHSPGPLFIKDSADRYMVVNQAFLAVSGRVAHEVIGKTDYELYPPELAELFVAEDREVRAGGEGRRYEQTFSHNGRARTFLSHKFPLPGGRIGYIGTDITERKAAEEALADMQARRLAAEQQHAARLQRLNIASMLINAAPTRADVLRLTGDEARALIGADRALVHLVPEGDWARAELAVSQPGPAGAAWAAATRPDEEVRRLVYGEGRTVRLIAAEHGGRGRAGGLLAAPLIDGDGMSTGLIQLTGKLEGPFTAADEALLQQLAQLASIALENLALYAQEQAARAQAEEASRLKDEFLGIVSHELRTPLTSFMGYAQLLQRRPHDPAFVARTVDQMLRSAKAQAQLIEDLLDVSRIVSGKLRIELAPIDLVDVIQAALDTARPTAEAKGLEVELDLDPAAGAVVGDASRLQQVVWNLLSNAAKFTPPGGRVRVRLAPAGGQAELRVSDTGQGIPAEFLPYVFDRFRQADSSSRRSYGGLGLGLAIVRHLVELHGGTVAAASDGAGQGAAFTVRLPLAGAGGRDGQARATPEDSRAPAEEDAPLRGVRVLVVDDQPAILDLLVAILASEGAEVRPCASAQEALELLRAWRPDVLVSDIAMPGQDGYWLLQQVRALAPEDGGDVPAVALTAYVRLDDRLRVLAAGFQQYVPKPVDTDELRNVILGLVGQGGERGPGG